MFADADFGAGLRFNVRGAKEVVGMRVGLERKK
jgi:hypothetical protein